MFCFDIFARFFKYNMLSRSKVSTFLLLLVMVCVPRTWAQITVTPTSTATALATALAGSGVTISSPSLTCAGVSNGTFTVTPGTLVGTGPAVFGINSGIVLSTGRVSSSAGSAATLASFNTGMAGDADLTTLAGASTYDACILEFDIIPTGDTIKFDYIFGSEEYNNSNCGPYNDAFAFFISGPGITGTANMALVPGTNIPVTVNSVNNGVPGSGYTLANCTSMGAGSPFTAYYDDNTGGSSFTMKGFTKVFTAIHDVIPCNTYHLKITIADAGNHLYDSEVFIKQGSIASATNTATASVCQGQNITVSATPAGGTWSSADVTIATVDPTSGFTTGLSAGVVDLTYTTGTGCYKITTLTVNPTPTMASTTSICTGTTMTLSATPTGGTWSGGLPGIVTVTSSGSATSGSSLGAAPVVYTSPAGCVLNTSVSVYSLPPVTGVFNVCEGGTTALSNTFPGGTWSSLAPTTAAVNAATGVVSGVLAGNTTITYSMGGGCYSTASVTVDPRPAAPTALPAHFCQYSVPGTLAASGSSLLWYPSPAGGTGSATTPVPSTTTPGTTTYYVTQTIGGCESSRTPLSVTIDPALIFQITGNPLACPDDTLTLGVSSVFPAVTYAWTLPTGVTLYPGYAVTDPSVRIINHSTTNQDIYLHITDVNTGCSGDDTFHLNINVPPAADAYTIANPCLGDTVGLALSGHSDDAYSYTWTIDNVSMSSSTALNIVTHSSNSGGPYTVSWLAPGIHVIAVQTTAPGNHCPSAIAYDTVEVHRQPDAQFSYQTFRGTPCLDDSVFFAARTFSIANLYQWTPSHAFYGKNDASIWGVVEDKQIDFTLTVTDPFGCKATSTQTVTAEPCCYVTVPTAFTPNGDGLNDFFRPLFISQGRDITGGTRPLSSSHKFHTFRITNRWGQIVFETTNNYPQWDGTFNGEPQDMGVYYYVLTFDCDNGEVVQKGDVTLIR